MHIFQYKMVYILGDTIALKKINYFFILLKML